MTTSSCTPRSATTTMATRVARRGENPRIVPMATKATIAKASSRSRMPSPSGSQKAAR